MNVPLQTPESFTVISPVDNKPYVTRPFASGKAIERALARAEEAAPTWRRVPLSERTAIVLRFGEEMAARADALADALSWQIGRPRWQADETPRLKLIGQLLAEAAGALRDEAFPSDSDVRRYVRREPLGINLSICAWNYPTAMIGYLASAPILAGNTVIFKHSPQTPTIAEMAEEAFRAAGAPPGVFQSIHLAHPDAEALIASGRLKAVNFIGSVAGGRAVHAAAGGAFTHVHLELGGKDPAYVRSDADLPKAVSQLAEGCFSNSGQSCCSVERLYVHADIHNRFVEAFTEEARKWTLGHPLDAKPMIGPVVRATAAVSIRRQIEEALNKGARRTVEPGRTSAATLGPCYVETEVLVGVDHSMTIMRDELFGPVACIQSVSNDAEAVRLMNDSSYGLSASVWTADVRAGEALLDQIDAGTVYLNRCDHADLYLPWGGFKQSGMGRINGRVGLESATQPKAFHIRERLP
jgi:acyl-CoA reductase-like NAD-dependent aldehyde dehydrogenase